MRKYKYKFYVSYTYTKGTGFGFGSCTCFKDHDNVPIKEFEDDINKDLKENGIADNIVVLNVLPEIVKGTKTKA